MVDIVRLLSTDGYIMCNKSIIRLFGGDCAILIGELCAEYNFYKNQNELAENDTFYSTQKHIQANTGLNDYVQRKAIKILQDAEIIKVVRKGLPAKNYYWINQNKLAEIFRTSSVKFTEQDAENLQINNNKYNNNNNSNNVSKDTLSPGKSSKPKKSKSLMPKQDKFKTCFAMILQFTDDKQVQDELKQYLQMRIKIGLTVEQWQGILDDCKTIPDNSLVASIHNSFISGYRKIYNCNNKNNNNFDTAKDNKLNPIDFATPEERREYRRRHQAVDENGNPIKF